MPSIVIARNQASGQNLVDSTKLARIVNDSKTSLPKEKKDKKERRKHRTEKREKSHRHSSKKSSKSPGVSEKSGVTEELEGPQNHLGYLSDGSLNSNKRKRDVSPPAVESLIKVVPVAGKPLRIRLTFKKPKVESPLPQEDVVSCSTSGSDSLIPARSTVCEPELNVPSTSEALIEETKKICEPEVNVPSTSEAAIAGEVKKRRKHKPSKEDRYNALFDDWTPISTTAMEVDFSSKDDDDWLFGGSRTKERRNCKAANKIDEDVRTSSDSSWPKAQFLSQVGIYSLPYTVPF
ncbi:unnamed protein product [Brassica oleracea]